MEQKLPATIDEYIAGQRPEIQPILGKLYQTIKDAAPEATEKNKLGNGHIFLSRKSGTFLRREKAYWVSSGTVRHYCLSRRSEGIPLLKGHGSVSL